MNYIECLFYVKIRFRPARLSRAYLSVRLSCKDLRLQLLNEGVQHWNSRIRKRRENPDNGEKLTKNRGNKLHRICSNSNCATPANISTELFSPGRQALQHHDRSRRRLAGRITADSSIIVH